MESEVNDIKGVVFDIQRFSTHDGPGIRTTVFLKGCPLACSWCHNPESQSAHYELFFNKKICIDCGSCNKTCPFGNAREILQDSELRKEKCGSCLLCANVCPANAIEKVGKIYTSDEIVSEIEKDLPFYENSNGGITISGGEPLLQYDFTIDILKKVKRKNIHTTIDTSGFASKEKFLEVAPYVDLFLWDIKITDENLHKKYTGAPLNPIIENLKVVDLYGTKTILSLILIPEVNMNDQHYKAIANIYSDLINVQGIRLLPYHEYGNSKNERLGIMNHDSYSEPTDKEMSDACKAIQKINNQIKILQ
ncbi:MAG: glycyl-radical enzyme activating protein [Bacteroidota bacterium]|nr:glycyl-radical enzyme activating protein [Bacteroidota bacterium]MDP4205177.1 glycyl-radical enzyme activating protein [Bacteroidota bacterium]